MAQALAGSPAAFDSQGLQQPAIDPVMLLAMMGGPALMKAATGTGEMAPEALASMAEANPDLLPALAKGAKTGDPHALYAYTDNFGPGMTPRKIFNVFGDTEHPAIKAAGWGSSLPAEALQKFGIPITGKQL